MSLHVFLNSIILLVTLCSANSLHANNLQASASNTTTTPTTILVLGDSISAGHNMNSQDGWVALLASALPNSIHVVNASVSGETAGGGLKRLPALLTTHKPNWIILELGANDGLRGYPLNQLKTTLESIVTLARQHHSQVILIDMQIPPNYGPRYTQRFSKIYAQLASEQQLPLVADFIQTVVFLPNMMQDDGLHPNEQAQPLLMQRVLEALQNQLPSMH